MDTDRRDDNAGQSAPKDKTRPVRNVAREAVKRLAFRMSKSADGLSDPGRAEVDRLCDLLTQPDTQAIESYVQELLADGNSVSKVHVSYLAAAARQLGQDWADDRRSFTDVTLGSGRVHQIIRDLSQIQDRAAGRRGDAPQVLLALAPGESHTLGIEIFANLMRDDGWDVEISVGGTRAGILSRARKSSHDVVVVVGYGQGDADVLAGLWKDLCAVLPNGTVLLAGAIVDTAQAASGIPPEDCLSDLANAVIRLRQCLKD